MPKLLLGFICISGIYMQSSAQDKAPEFGLGSGLAIYQGDLSPYRHGSLRKADLSFQLFSNIPVHPVFSIRASYAFAALQENENSYTSGYKPYRNLSFKTLVNELSVQLIISPLAPVLPDQHNLPVPYLMGGVGYAFLRISRYWNGFDRNWQHWQEWVVDGLAKDSAYSLPNTTLTFPIGVGIRYRVGENFSLFAEGIHRITKEEYLDGFSKACNPNKKDAFTTFTAGVLFQRTFYSNSIPKRASY